TPGHQTAAAVQQRPASQLALGGLDRIHQGISLGNTNQLAAVLSDVMLCKFIDKFAQPGRVDCYCVEQSLLVDIDDDVDDLRNVVQLIIDDRQFAGFFEAQQILRDRLTPLQNAPMTPAVGPL